MSSTVKNPWRLVAGTLTFSLVLLVIPSLVMAPEIKAVSKIWYYVVLRGIAVVLFAFFTVKTVLTRNDDNSAGTRAITIALAAIYFIITMAGAAQYRSDKTDGIQFDKPVENGGH